ncbi:uncharacterized protein B0H18DRAFT_1121218 [Fomitopsis serialis]|uniref:uncharacterized protein n=1 Tax=Fomitopsis serialis TaxID=139415 RepID=UPI002008556C|nr:uncharacterized protein B0H18DRAFT_1121218 [Neoantrodia serialis]KAH9921754.1 hypothetical protein B0H18DRAFT_1121218 [Neoantrodia serialis]
MLDLKRLFRRIARPEARAASELSPIYRTSVRRSWISALARAPNIRSARKNKARQPGKRKEPLRPTESMMVAVPSVEAPRTSSGPGESSTLSGGEAWNRSMANRWIYGPGALGSASCSSERSLEVFIPARRVTTRMLSEYPNERMDIASISRYSGFDQPMGIKWKDVLRK